MLTAFARFTRPHTIVATTVQVVALFFITGGSHLFSFPVLGSVLLTLFTCLALNIYVVGLNQITDVDIDRINKPSLPLAAKTMTVQQGWFAVIVLGVAALLGGLVAGPYLLATVILIMCIGTAYSVPPLRLKRYSAWAAVSIAFARGVIANIGVALHFDHTFNASGALSIATILEIAAFFFCFGLVIAIYKDIPDMLGDRAFGIQSFTVKLGPQRAFNLGRFILTGAYLGVITIALVQLPSPNGIVLLATQFAALILFWYLSSKVNLWQPASTTRFYMFLWGLFYAEYLVLSMVQISGSVV